jgi:beta-galactosidase
MVSQKKMLALRISFCAMFCFVSIATAQTFPRQDMRLGGPWLFYRGDVTGADQPAYNDAAWDSVCLPHTARVESAKTHTNWDYYIGYCWYRKSFVPDSIYRGKKVFLEIEAGMQTTEVWINGTKKITNQGGYNPFTVDISGDIHFNQTNVVAVRLDNHANINFSPGAEKRDFYYYGGLYRYVNLHVMDSLHITDALYANLPASGGVFVTYPSVNASSATVRVKTHVMNESGTDKSCVLTTTILDSSGTEVQTLSTTQAISAFANDTFVQLFTVGNPRLWSPYAPNLYDVRSRLYDDTRPADEVHTTIGIRTIEFSHTGGFLLNGKRMNSVGMNRHQDYGAIGNAVPVSGQYRDALRMKEAGVNFVRLSHYQQSQAFLDACDKLGITVQASLTGWQNGSMYLNPTFVKNCLRDLRTLIRSYRNHPCVVMWESVINESNPPASFCDSAQRIAHAEYPGDQMYTCGQETNNILDIYQAAVQQGARTYVTTKPQAISEYGHWEWGGFTYGGTSSNQPRAIGEAGMLTLAGNQETAVSLNHALPWLSVDALWLYNETFGFSQYNNSLCGGGIVDVFRIPKFGYYFFQSQRDTARFTIPGAAVSSGPMVYIANFWTQTSPLSVTVFSNCSQVSLYYNDVLIATQSPDVLANVDHPPFTFVVPGFAAGTLRADGLINGTVVASHSVSTPLAPAKVAVTIDTATLSLAADG